MTKINHIFKKVHGGYFGIISAIIGLITLLIASILQSLTEPFTMFTLFVSNLQQGPNGANIVFVIGFTFCIIIAIPFFIYLYQFLQEGSGKKDLILTIAFISSMIGAIGIIIAVIADYKLYLYVHWIGAMVFFFIMIITCILFSISMIQNKKISKMQGITGFIVAPFFIIFLLFFWSTFFPPGLVFGIFYPGPNYELAKFTEWLAIFAFIAWILDLGIYLIKIDEI